MNREGSTNVHSNQSSIHDDLARLVQKHMASTWQEPTPPHDREAMKEIIALLKAHKGPLILDSFCGTGMSTAKLASQQPKALVIGIDKSADRLRRHVHTQSRNYHLIRGNCEHIWAQMVSANVVCAQHYLLYPNPWPKKAHLKRRIHGHPSFPLLKQLGGAIEVRSNWKIYVDEFAAASQLLGLDTQVESLSATDPLTLFERKYAANSENLWVCRAALA
ncbi:MAG TPA: methyltransferase [Halieaceae bacterium]|nr:methyltransferase [Halieaceae bacterium]